MDMSASGTEEVEIHRTPTEPTEQATSPLTSDAETEPLSMDEEDGMNVQKIAEDHVSMPQKEVHMEPSATSEQAAGQLGDESDLTDESDQAKPNPESIEHEPVKEDEDSSLSEDVGDHTLKPGGNEAESQHSALDGLAVLAASETEGEKHEDVDAIAPSSSVLTPEASQDEATEDMEADDEGEEDDEEEPIPNKGARKEPSLHRAVMAAVGKRRAAATGGAPSLLVQPDADASNPPSASTSRQGSPVEDVQTKEETPAEEESAETGGQATEAAENEDEASDHRQEALEQLTRIELGFVMLRQRLYAERIEELEREANMIHQGTHPEIQMLHTLIDLRKEKRLRYLGMWLQCRLREHERRAQAEEKIAWVNWRDRAASLRRDMMGEMDRKRRKLEREKRMLDAPQPMRRYQPFEAEFAHKPPSYSRWTRQRPDQYLPYGASLRDPRSFVAFPDVRGLEEYDAWMDMEQMGIRPVPMPPPTYLRPDDMPPHEMYAAPSYAGGLPGSEPMGYYGPPEAGPPYVEHSRPLPPVAAPYEGMYVEPMEMSSHPADLEGAPPAAAPPLPPSRGLPAQLGPPPSAAGRPPFAAEQPMGIPISHVVRA